MECISTLLVEETKNGNEQIKALTLKRIRDHKIEVRAVDKCCQRKGLSPFVLALCSVSIIL